MEAWAKNVGGGAGLIAPHLFGVSERRRCAGIGVQALCFR